MENITTFSKYHLQKIAREIHIHVSGTKRKIIDRINDFYKKHKNAILIQKQLRGYFVRKLFRQHSMFHVDTCVNDTDFYTLDPIQQIPFHLLFCYTGKEQITYGFHLESLIELYTTNGKIVNPYNREEFSLPTMLIFFSLCAKTNIIFHSAHLLIPSSKEYYLLCHPNVLNDIVPLKSSMLRTLMNTYLNVENKKNVGTILKYMVSLQLKTKYHAQLTIDKLNATTVLLQNMRETPLHIRIERLFHEFYMLDYAIPTYIFTEFDLYDVIELYQIFRYTWRSMNDTMKLAIYPFGNPFITTPFHLKNCIHTYDGMIACVTFMENMIFSGIDVDDRSFAAMHIQFIFNFI